MPLDYIDKLSAAGLPTRDDILSTLKKHFSEGFIDKMAASATNAFLKDLESQLLPAAHRHSLAIRHMEGLVNEEIGDTVVPLRRLYATISSLRLDWEHRNKKRLGDMSRSDVYDFFEDNSSDAYKALQIVTSCEEAIRDIAASDGDSLRAELQNWISKHLRPNLPLTVNNIAA